MKIVIDAFVPQQTEAHVILISLEDLLCSCNSNLAMKVIRRTISRYVIVLWTTVSHVSQFYWGCGLQYIDEKVNPKALQLASLRRLVWH